MLTVGLLVVCVSVVIVSIIKCYHCIKRYKQEINEYKSEVEVWEQQHKTLTEQIQNIKHKCINKIHFLENDVGTVGLQSNDSPTAIQIHMQNANNTARLRAVKKLYTDLFGE